MIIISHNRRDKAIAEPVANRLAKIYGEETIVGDEWVAQPGEGIITRITRDPDKPAFFLLFVSKNSLQGDLLNFQWQNTILNVLAEPPMMVPIRCDDCIMPPVLRQNLYIDYQRYGLEVTLRQLIDVIEGSHAFRNPNREFSNLKAYWHNEAGKTVVECHAEHYVEPTSSYLFIIGNKEEDVFYETRHPIPAKKSFHKNIPLGKDTYNAVHVGFEKMTAPGFPVILELTPISRSVIRFICVMHEYKPGNWKPIPTVFGRK